jgi:hypothetical protein
LEIPTTQAVFWAHPIREHLIKAHTSQQQLAFLLSSIGVRQIEIGRILHKPRSAISRLISRGGTNLLIRLDQQIQECLLSSQEEIDHEDFLLSRLRDRIHSMKQSDLLFDGQIRDLIKQNHKKGAK